MHQRQINEMVRGITLSLNNKPANHKLPSLINIVNGLLQREIKNVYSFSSFFNIYLTYPQKKNLKIYHTRNRNDGIFTKSINTQRQIYSLSTSSNFSQLKKQLIFSYQFFTLQYTSPESPKCQFLYMVTFRFFIQWNWQ